MSPEDLKKIALNASKAEYEAIMAKMKSASELGSFTCNFNDISDGAIEQLKDAGFTVFKRMKPKTSMLSTPTQYYYEVGFAK